MSHNTHKVCMKVQKVYDWVQRQVELPLISINDCDFENMFDCKGYKHDTDICRLLMGRDVDVHCSLLEDTLLVKEIEQPKGRKQLTTTLPNGETVTLEKVKVLVKGLLDVTLVDADTGAAICKTKKGHEVKFATAQTFFLCAPDGTDIYGKLTYFQCDADVICHDDDTPFEQLDVSVLFCLDVQAETDVKVEVDAAICKPREELPIADIVCPDDRFPPQCPEIFPSSRN